ncbi:hypothetical protein HK097_003609 [Rhizophlyctis rosea]|uniref:Protein kinase domain-containing protein n=1 Tax=Rhizophlyctis rosea TaxID=64517 RepID=A0AAD5S386_9FUNG|nr:hypothetical protein HK097_003609 [Rhizophlyctis rosea]
MVLIGDHYEPLKKIGEGAHGEVFSGLDKRSGNVVAIKREDKGRGNVSKEAEILQLLSGLPGFPELLYQGETETYGFIVMEHYGPTLKLIRGQTSFGRFPLEAVICFGMQMLDLLQTIHSKGIVHCDIKTENILAQASLLETDTNLTSFRPHLIDFASSKFWPPPPSLIKKKKRRRSSATKIGTTKYASLNLHKGKEPSPRDDIESLLYLLIDLHNRKLPWSGVLNKNWTRIGEIKDEILLCDLCSGMPVPFLACLEYVRGLGARTRIDYERIRDGLRECFGVGVRIVGGMEGNGVGNGVSSR